MRFKDYLKNNHPDPDTLLGKPVHEALDELTNLHRDYLIYKLESVKVKPHDADVVWDFNMGVIAAINKIKWI